MPCIGCRLLPLIGTSAASAGKSCKEILQVLSNDDCHGPAKSRTYWVKVPNDTCSGTEDTMQVCMLYMWKYSEVTAGQEHKVNHISGICKL